MKFKSLLTIAAVAASLSATAADGYWSGRNIGWPLQAKGENDGFVEAGWTRVHMTGKDGDRENVEFIRQTQIKSGDAFKIQTVSLNKTLLDNGEVKPTNIPAEYQYVALRYRNVNKPASQCCTFMHMYSGQDNLQFTPGGVSITGDGDNDWKTLFVSITNRVNVPVYKGGDATMTAQGPGMSESVKVDPSTPRWGLGVEAGATNFLWLIFHDITSEGATMDYQREMRFLTQAEYEAEVAKEYSKEYSAPVPLSIACANPTDWTVANDPNQPTAEFFGVATGTNPTLALAGMSYIRPDSYKFVEFDYLWFCPEAANGHLVDFFALPAFPGITGGQGTKYTMTPVKTDDPEDTSEEEWQHAKVDLSTLFEATSFGKKPLSGDYLWLRTTPTGAPAYIWLKNVKVTDGQGDSGIDNIEADSNAEVIATRYFDLQGRQLKAEPAEGLFIRQDVKADNTVKSVKVVK